jgi:putative transcriptional regulator
MSDQSTERDAYGMTAADWAHLRGMTQAEVLAAARRDPDARPLEDRRPERVGPARRVSFAKRIRWQLGLSQTEFAELFRIPAGTLRDWEQHRREPDQAARAYLEVIARNPGAVLEALKASPRRGR